MCRLVGPIFLPPDASPTITPLERERSNPTAWQFPSPMQPIDK
ncbi:hypothetical protein HMPREF9080_01120 [Cardiobacterium valvarum F0432]|uniref:Uncharacterized protein n=1 Tax=Cardiobacterium valvarum F0432 TaxID=797473 RepID=G9ZED5_9GAMM|nr:hypothetical protein HMPREF9080_01120 [Cardiobacterium valvarum F0432]